MSVPFIPTKNATAGVTTAPTASNLTTAGQMAINAYTGTMYMRKEDNTISDIVGDRLSGFRNRLINGDMRIDQRNAGASVTIPANTSTYTLDRWRFLGSQASKFLSQQNQGSITPPAAFKNYLGIVSTSAYSVSSADYFLSQQLVEGFNVSDLAWGTSSAASITISFFVRSNSLTGTFGGSVSNGALNRSYPFSYTISATNTWEQKSITIPGDTSGTWASDNSIGLRLSFSLGAGSTYSGTAGAWSASELYSATGATSVVGTNGAALYITGVQLEKGLVPTPFEVRSYGTELALCQRYYEVTGIYVSTSAWTTITNPSTPKVSKRTAPTLVISNIGAGSGAAFTWHPLSGDTGSGVAYQTTANTISASAILSFISEL